MLYPISEFLFIESISTFFFRPKGGGVTGEWRKLHNKELNDMYCSPNIVRLIKPRRMKWARHAARMRRGDEYIGFGEET